MTNKEYDVFISYTHDDKEDVVKIVEALRAKKLKVWFDDKEVKDYEEIMRHLTRGFHAQRL